MNKFNKFKRPAIYLSVLLFGVIIGQGGKPEVITKVETKEVIKEVPSEAEIKSKIACVKIIKEYALVDQELSVFFNSIDPSSYLNLTTSISSASDKLATAKKSANSTIAGLQDECFGETK